MAFNLPRKSHDLKVAELQISPAERADLGSWKRAYDARYFITSQQMDSLHMEEKINQVERTHVSKLSYFTTHSFPTATWIDVAEMNKEKSRTVGQPTYYGCDNPVMPRLQKMSLQDKKMYPRLNMGSKTSMVMIPPKGRGDLASGLGVSRKLK